MYGMVSFSAPTRTINASIASDRAEKRKIMDSLYLILEMEMAMHFEKLGKKMCENIILFINNDSKLEAIDEKDCEA